MTQQTVPQFLMDLKIFLLHDSVLRDKKNGPTALRGNNGWVSHESSDCETHICRLGYSFVSRHIISQFQTCTDSRLEFPPSRGQSQSWTRAACIKSVQSILFLPVTVTGIKPAHRCHDLAIICLIKVRTQCSVLSGKAILMGLILIKVQQCCLTYSTIRAIDSVP